MNTKKPKTKLTEIKKIKIRNDFVQGIEKDNKRIYPTLDELIKKYKVAQSTVYRTARNENWKLQKEQFQSNLQVELDKERQKDLVKRSKSNDDNSLNIANGLYVMIGQIMTQHNQDMQSGKKSLPPTQINALASAALSAQRLAKIALGEVTENINATISENNDSFRRAMELLDEVEESRIRSVQSTH